MSKSKDELTMHNASETELIHFFQGKEIDFQEKYWLNCNSDKNNRTKCGFSSSYLKEKYIQWSRSVSLSFN